MVLYIQYSTENRYSAFSSDTPDRSAAVGVNGALAKLDRLGVGLRETHIPSAAIVVVKESILKLHILKGSSYL